MNRRSGKKLITSEIADIVGIDLGYSNMGICFLNENGIYKTQCFTVNDKKLVKAKKQIAFIKEHFMGLGISFLFKDKKLVCIEKPFNIKGHGIALIELLGIIKYHCIMNGISYVEIPQMTLKKFATGSGKAEKSEMVMQAFKEFKVEANTEDEIDAFFCALVGDCLLCPEKYSKNRIDAIKKLEVISIK